MIRDGEDYLVEQVLPVTDQNYMCLLQIRNRLRAAGYSVIIERIRADGMYQLLRSVRPFLRREPSIVQEEHIHEE